MWNLADTVPPAWRLYFCISSTALIVPLVTNDDKLIRHAACEVICDSESASTAAIAFGQLLTIFVSFCVFRIDTWLAIHHDYLRQDEGRYLPSSVLGVHVQAILPPMSVGDSTRYLLMLVIRLLALGPL